MEDYIICRCEGVRLSEIMTAIDEGGDTFPGVKKRTRTGMGFCQGRVCQQVIHDIIKSKTGKSVILQKAQIPVRPILLKEL